MKFTPQIERLRTVDAGQIIVGEYYDYKIQQAILFLNQNRKLQFALVCVWCVCRCPFR